MQDAPLFHNITKGPVGGKAYWVTTSNGVRLRVGHWPATKAASEFGGEYNYPQSWDSVAVSRPNGIY